MICRHFFIMEKLVFFLLPLLWLSESRSISGRLSPSAYHRFAQRPVRRLERDSDTDNQTFGVRVSIAEQTESPTIPSSTEPSSISAEEISTTLATPVESVQPEYETIRIIADTIKPEQPLLENLRGLSEPINAVDDSQTSNVYTPYNFSYSTDDGEGNTNFREEYSDESGTVRGRYGYQTSVGLLRLVEYIADDLGYRAVITSNEPGVEESNPFPADVVIKKNPVPEKILERYAVKPINTVDS